jgi:large subunit ribosomal protein L19
MNMHSMTISPVVAERKKLDIRAGDTVKVWQKIQEKGKTRLQMFDGLVLAVKHGKEAGGTFTVRKVASGVGVEKIFPIYSPLIDKIEVVKRSKVRRGKLYHVRHEAAKEIKRQMRNLRTIKPQQDDAAPAEEITAEGPAEAKAEAATA